MSHSTWYIRERPYVGFAGIVAFGICSKSFEGSVVEAAWTPTIEFFSFRIINDITRSSNRIGGGSVAIKT